MKEKRFALVVLIVTLLLLVFCILLNTVRAEEKKWEKLEKVEYVVDRGDTLWEIAEENCPSNLDIREYIFRIQKLNDINDSHIEPGDVIVILVVAE